MKTPNKGRPGSPEYEHRKDLVKERLKTRKLFRICNALLRKQQICGHLCRWCKVECLEARAWLTAEERKELDVFEVHQVPEE